MDQYVALASSSNNVTRHLYGLVQSIPRGSRNYTQQELVVELNQLQGLVRRTLTSLVDEYDSLWKDLQLAKMQSKVGHNGWENFVNHVDKGVSLLDSEHTNGLVSKSLLAVGLVALALLLFCGICCARRWRDIICGAVCPPRQNGRIYQAPQEI